VVIFTREMNPMKKLQGGMIVTFVVALIVSCTKDKVVPSAAETVGITLAGAKGSSKSWKITSLKYSKNGGAIQGGTLLACQMDDIFKFSNNDDQDFEHNEGATKCTSTDSTIAENGSWALTSNAKRVDFDLQMYSSEYLLTGLGPGTVVSLTDTDMELSFTQFASPDTYELFLYFSKI
jgi:hypothetical protein